MVRRPSVPVLFAMIAALAAIALAAVLVFQQVTTGRSGSTGAGISFMPAVSVGGPFELRNGAGETITDKDLHGKHALLYFGYTYCPDVCPTELSNMSAALDLLPGDVENRVTPVFITVDPERDTPSVVADYAAVFHPRMIGLTGDAEAISSVAKAYGVYFAISGDQSEEDYLVDHSGFVYLLGPDGSLVTMFRPQADPEKMAAVIANFVGGGN